MIHFSVQLIDHMEPHKHTEEKSGKINSWMSIYVVRNTKSSPLRLAIQGTSLKWVASSSNSADMIIIVQDGFLFLTNTFWLVWSMASDLCIYVGYTNCSVNDLTFPC